MMLAAMGAAGMGERGAFRWPRPARRRADGCRVQAQLGQDGVGVLAQRGHGVQRGSPSASCPAAAAPGTGPAGVSTSRQRRARPAAGAPTPRPCVDLGVGDLRVFQPLGHLRGGQAAKASTMMARSASRCGAACGVAGKALVGGQFGLQQHLAQN
jgi:hypothetical protein